MGTSSWLLVALVCFSPRLAQGITLYVDLNNLAPAAPYTNWATAATSIQDAVDAAEDGDTVLVTNGVYDTGGRPASSGTMTNRVNIGRAVAVCSVNGPEFTVIKGEGPIGDSAVRCAYVTNGAVLVGFTLTNGATRAWGDYSRECSGGGAWCEPAGILSNCTLTGNTADKSGGGAYGGTLNDCKLMGNTAPDGNGGGVYGGVLNRCTLTGNLAGDSGGGAFAGTLICCTLTGNGAFSGGGASNCDLTDCTLTGNYAYYGGGGAGEGRLNNCVLSANWSQYGGGAYVGTLSNCTLTGNAATWGGGASSCDLTDCTLTGNSADHNGGGLCYGTLNNCVLSANSAYFEGGGAYVGTLSNCVLTYNSARYGGGSYESTLHNCTLVANVANGWDTVGGGAFGGTLNNCIAYYNIAPRYANWYESRMSHCCTTPAAGGTASFTNEPQFVNLTKSNFHSLATSPCINTGNDASVSGTTDLDSNGRIQCGRVDMGAYESPYWGTFSDVDGDGMKDADEIVADTDPTNAESVLCLLSIREQWGGVRLDWKGGRDAWQFLEIRTDLVNTTEQWTAIYGIPPPTPLTNAVITFGATNRMLFFRIRARH